MGFLYFIWDHLGEIASVVSIVGANWAVIMWSHRGLHDDIMAMKEDAKATNLRIDATGTRIDNLYNVMLGMLKKAE
jgi:hypothetical protein